MKTRYSAFTAASLLVGGALIAKAVRTWRSMDLEGRVAVITGGSRGLGLLIAREMGRQGVHVVLVARDPSELDRARDELYASGVDVSVIVADVSGAGSDAADAEARRIVSSTVARHGRLDILVNNAGVIKVGPAEHMTIADYEEAMATHFWGPLHLMRAVVPHMKQLGGGRIANISSIGGKIGVPHLVPYSASKFALAGVSSALGAELAQHDVRVSTIYPGLMRTGSPFNASFKGKHREEFAWFAIADSLPLMSIDGRRAAAQIVDAIQHGDPELVVSWPARVAVAAAALMPNLAAVLASVSNRMLPSPADAPSEASHTGWQSTSSWAPSRLTRMTERAAAENNEVPGPPPSTAEEPA